MAGAGGGRGKREHDSWMQRQNSALRERGYRVSLELHQGLIRLRATLPPKPSDPPSAPWKQRRISTGVRYPDQASDAVKQAEQLGAAIELTLRTREPFDWSAWDRPSAGSNRVPVGTSASISGVDALRQTELWWAQQKRRSQSAVTTWDVDYARPLSPLLKIERLQPQNLLDLVSATKPCTRARKRCSQAAATVAKVLEMSAELQQQIRDLGKGYSPLTDTAPRDVPSDGELMSFIDALPADWQWPVGICAVYGARPHEALLYAEVLASKLLAISGGKTGARMSFALPAAWIERWELTRKRLPAIDFTGGNKKVGSQMSIFFRSVNASFQPYDVRHAYAVRTIYFPKISPSMGAKSMGHSLQVHFQIYQKWFDASGMESLQVELLNAAD